MFMSRHQGVQDKITKMGRLTIQGEPGPVRQNLRSDKSRREVYLLSSTPYLPTRRLGAYRARTCIQPVHFESVYVYVYYVAPTD
jgi:hypothetical protein